MSDRVPEAAQPASRPQPPQAPSTPEEVKAAAERFRADFAAVREQVGRAVVGHSAVVEHVLIALFCGGHALLEGVPGIGKTLLIRSLARALELKFSRIQFTPDLMPADITGTTVVLETESTGPGGSGGGGGGGGQRTRQFVFQRGPIFAQMVLADEINRATPKTQSALLEAMQERSVTVGGVTHPLERPFFVMATQNPIEQEGTYPLPEAQLDRFLFKINVGYAGRKDLSEILDRTTGGSEASVQRVLDAARLIAHQDLIRRVALAEHVKDYAVRVVLATHPKTDGLGGGEFATPMVNKFVRVGASPRAAQAIALGAKCRALLDGRPAASTDDVRSVALAALRHRVIMNFESQAEGVSADAVIENIIATLPLGSGK
jgi:MoxR-like ATPase